MVDVLTYQCYQANQQRGRGRGRSKQHEVTHEQRLHMVCLNIFNQKLLIIVVIVGVYSSECWKASTLQPAQVAWALLSLTAQVEHVKINNLWRVDLGQKRKAWHICVHCFTKSPLKANLLYHNISMILLYIMINNYYYESLCRSTGKVQVNHFTIDYKYTPFSFSRVKRYSTNSLGLLAWKFFFMA